MAATLDELSGGRFILGIGVSHKVTVEWMWGLQLEHPRPRCASTSTIVRTSLADGGCVLRRQAFHARTGLTRRRGAARPADHDLGAQPTHAGAGGRAGRRRRPLDVLAVVHPRPRRAARSRRAARRPANRWTASRSWRRSRPASPPTAQERARCFARRSSATRTCPYYRKMMDASGFKEELEAGEVSDAHARRAGAASAMSRRCAIDRAAIRDAGVTLPVRGSVRRPRRRGRLRGDAGGGAGGLGQLADRVVEELARGVELAPDGGVLGAIEQLDHVLPPLGVALVQCCPDLADGLGREQQAAAGVVEDRGGRSRADREPRRRSRRRDGSRASWA